MRVLAALLFLSSIASAQTTALHHWNRREPIPGVEGGGLLARDLARGVNVLLTSSAVQLSNTLTAFEVVTWEWADTRWCRRSVALPQLLLSTAVSYDPTRRALLLYGTAAPPQSGAQTWLYDGATWTQMPGAGTPGMRTAFGLAPDLQRSRVVMSGGVLAGAILSDTWEWDGTTWTQVGGGFPPLPRFAPMMAFNPATGRVAMCGGIHWNSPGYLPGGLSIVYEWTGSSWLAINSGNPQLQGITGYVAVSDLNTGVWVLSPTSASPSNCELRHWNGASWTLAPGLHEQRFNLVADAADRLFAFGGITEPLGTFAYTPSQNLWQMLLPGNHPIGEVGWSFGCVEPWDALLFTKSTGQGATELWRLDTDGSFSRLLQATYDTSSPQLMAFHPPSGRVLLLNSYTGATGSYDGQALVAHGALAVSAGLPYLVGHHPATGRVLALVRNAQQNIEVWGWAPTSWTLLAVGPAMNDQPVGAVDGPRNRLVIAARDGSAAAEWDGTSFTAIPVPAGVSSYSMLPHPEGGIAWIEPSLIHRWDGTSWTTSTIANPHFGLNGAGRTPTQFDVRRRRWVARDAGVLYDLEPAAWTVDEPAPLPGSSIGFSFDRQASAGRPWLTLLSTGDAPGIPWRPSPWYGTEIVPLNNDWLFASSLGLGLGGVLDANGRGQVLLGVPNLPLTGFRCFAAAVTFGTAQPLEFVSPALTICIRR